MVVLNTCAFIQEATEESIAEALALAGEWRPAREGRALVVAGCMPSRYGDDLAEAMPEVDAFVPVADEHSRARACWRASRDARRSLTPGPWRAPRGRPPRTSR